MMGLSTTHLIIFLVIIVLIFGTKKLKNIGADIGGAVKGFKDGMKTGTPTDNPADPAKPTAATAQVTTENRAAPGDTIDVEAKNKG